MNVDDAPTPRGIRNNNPGNIRHSPTQWLGQSAEQPDAAFVRFDDARHGIRALYKILRTYQVKHRLGSIAAIINRWAPPAENDTAAYVRAVAAACGVEPTKVINIVSDQALAEKLVAAIIQHENGQQPYSAAEIRAAIELA